MKAVAASSSPPASPLQAGTETPEVTAAKSADGGKACLSEATKNKIAGTDGTAGAVEEEFYSKNDWLPNATRRRGGRRKTE